MIIKTFIVLIFIILIFWGGYCIGRLCEIKKLFELIRIMDEQNNEWSSFCEKSNNEWAEYCETLIDKIKTLESEVDTE